MVQRPSRMLSKYVFVMPFKDMSVARAMDLLKKWNEFEDYEAWIDGDEQALVVIDRTHVVSKKRNAASDAVDAALNVVRGDWY